MRSSIPLEEFLSSKFAKKPFAAVIGQPVHHSLSPLIHNFSLEKVGIDVTYYPIEVAAERLFLLSDLFHHEYFRGANVTIPHKRSVVTFLNNTSQTVKDTGACNTVVPRSDGLFGDNTDVAGFMMPLLKYIDRFSGKDALVFGSGGASSAIVYGLSKTPLRHIYIVSRSHKNKSDETLPANTSFITYDQWPDIADKCMLFVNTTPVGMYPDINKSVIPDSLAILVNRKLCYDIIYRPQKTFFLKQAAAQNAICIDGTEMFLGQAAVAFELFFKHKFPVGSVRPVLNKALEL
jgi:shikimate dehydrogenase